MSGGGRRGEEKDEDGMQQMRTHKTVGYQNSHNPFTPLHTGTDTRHRAASIFPRLHQPCLLLLHTNRQVIKKIQGRLGEPCRTRSILRTCCPRRLYPAHIRLSPLPLKLSTPFLLIWIDHPALCLGLTRLLCIIGGRGLKSSTASIGGDIRAAILSKGPRWPARPKRLKTKGRVWR